MLNYEFDIKSGTISPDTSLVQSQVTAEFKAVFGEDLNTDPRTLQGTLIVIETIARVAVLRNNCQQANQLNPNLAGGINLDAIGKLTDSNRVANQFTLVSTNLAGDPGTPLESSTTLAQDVTNNNIFSLLSNVTLDVNGNGVGIFKSVLPGPIAVGAHNLSRVLSGPLGWETVDNPTSQTTLGELEQSDEGFRNQRRVTLASQGTALSEAITSAVGNVPNVNSVSFAENYTSSPLTIGGVTLIPHSIYVCVNGGDDTAVAAAIQEKTAGLGFNGAVTVDITDPFSGQVIPVQFDRPTLIPVIARVTAQQNLFTQDVEVAIRDAIYDYSNGDLPQRPGLIPGKAVSAFEFSGACNTEAPGIYVGFVEISLRDTVSYQTDPLPMNLNQQATIAKEDITVIIT